MKTAAIEAHIEQLRVTLSQPPADPMSVWWRIVRGMAHSEVDVYEEQAALAALGLTKEEALRKVKRRRKP